MPAPSQYESRAFPSDGAEAASRPAAITAGPKAAGISQVQSMAAPTAPATRTAVRMPASPRQVRGTGACRTERDGCDEPGEQQDARDPQLRGLLQRERMRVPDEERNVRVLRPLILISPSADPGHRGRSRRRGPPRLQNCQRPFELRPARADGRRCTGRRRRLPESSRQRSAGLAATTAAATASAATTAAAIPIASRPERSDERRRGPSSGRQRRGPPRRRAPTSGRRRSASPSRPLRWSGRASRGRRGSGHRHRRRLWRSGSAAECDPRWPATSTISPAATASRPAPGARQPDPEAGHRYRPDGDRAQGTRRSSRRGDRRAARLQQPSAPRRRSSSRPDRRAFLPRWEYRCARC